MSSEIESRTGGCRPLRGILAASLLRRLLNCVEHGRLVVRTPEGVTLERQSGRPGPEGVLVLHRWRAIRRMLAGGDVAFAEAYVEGEWSTPDLVALLELAAVNIDGIDRAAAGSTPVRFLHRLRHMLRANSRRGSRRNIAFHYDLGNDFYRLWLDPGMLYSSALYEKPTDTLEEAQENKLRRIGELLDLSPGQSVLEIGCGWGALAARMASAGALVKGITLSAEQLAHARTLGEKNGLSESMRFELEDYRDTGGSFDRVVSIEMFEAVGEQYWPTYFDTLRRLLKGDGHAVLQIISIDESRFDGYRRGADFIQRHIFPGGMLPTGTIIRRLAQEHGFSLVSAENFGGSYALTLAEWHKRFQRNWPAIQRLGFDQRFRRLWEYYLAYCEAGFRAGTIDVGLYVLKPEAEYG